MAWASRRCIRRQRAWAFSGYASMRVCEYASMGLSHPNEAWRKRRYKRHWISKLTDAEQEAAETQVWIEVARDCGYIKDAEFEDLLDQYDKIIAQLIMMGTHAEKWVLRRPAS